MSKRNLPGVNIQFPWSELLVSGKKKIETRSYPLPQKFVGVELAVIETPGKTGKRNGISKARIVGTITFGESKEYKTKASWMRDHKLHLVSENDPKFSFDPKRPKYGWPVLAVARLNSPTPPPPRRGIIFARDCKV